jgi:molecular chaperone Hsp33
MRQVHLRRAAPYLERMTATPAFLDSARPEVPDIVVPRGVTPFHLPGRPVRGRLVRLGPLADALLTRHDNHPVVTQLSGQALALAAALASALKFRGSFSIQAKGDGPVPMLLADCTESGALRGYARANMDRLASVLAADSEPSAAALLGAGYLAFTVDQGPDTERYQGIVELIGGTLADCAHHYFRQSEQLQAGIRLACGLTRAEDGSQRWRAGALMLQRLPEEGGSGNGDAREVEEAEDDWRRSLFMMGSSRSDELLDPHLAPNDLLFRLFHEDGVRVYPVHVLKAECRCSRARVAGMLKALPRQEVESLKLDDDAVIVTCEFCSAQYRFDDDDLAALYAD